MKEIIRLASLGEGEALRKIYSLYKKQVYYFCAKLMANSTDAAEMCAETFECAFSRLDTLEDPEQFDIWIKNIAAIRCFNYIHKMKPMLFLQVVADTEDLLFSEAEIEEMPRGSVEETQTCIFMDKMMDRLNDAQRMTLMFHYYNGLSLVQIAKIMSCTVDIVKQRMGKAAEHMRNTISALSEQGIQLKEVDFRTSLRLMAACASVPEIVDAQVEGIILSIAPEEEPQKTETDYNFESFEVKQESAPVLDDTENISSDEEISLSDIKTDPVAIKTQNKKEPPKFLEKVKSLTVMQQSVALLVIVAIVAGVIIGVSRAGKKKNPDMVAQESQLSSTVSETVSEPEVQDVVAVPENKMKVVTEKQEIKAEDGTVVARVTFQYPEVTLGENTVAEEEINGFFESKKVGAAFDKIGMFANLESGSEGYIYGYNHQDHGEWKLNEISVTLDKGIINEDLLSFRLNRKEQVYGFPNNQHQAMAYNFSTRSGEQIKIADIMADANGYYDFAAQYIKTKLEENQSAGKYYLLSTYPDAVDTVVKQDGNWYLTEKGITIVFNPNEVADIGYGVLSVELPYAEINEYLKLEYQKQ